MARRDRDLRSFDMRAIRIKKYGGPDVLEVREQADPTPKTGEVRVRVRACGLNFAELMAREGCTPTPPSRPAWWATKRPDRRRGRGGGHRAPRRHFGACAHTFRRSRRRVACPLPRHA